MTITGVETTLPNGTDGLAYFITPAQVAQRVHGTVAIQGAQS